MKKFLYFFITIFLITTYPNYVSAQEVSNQLDTTEDAQDGAQDRPRLVTPEQLQAGNRQDARGQFLRLTEQKTAPDLQCILDRNRIDVAIYDGDAPPFFMKDREGNLTGLDAAIAKHLAAELGVKVSFIKVKSFNDVVQAVVDGKADVGISKLSVTLERAKQVRYTGRYVNMGKALLVNRLLLQKFQEKDDITLEEVFAQKGAKIGVIANSSFVQFAKRIFPQAELVEYPNWDSIVKDVLNDKLLAAFRDEWEVRKVMSDNPDAPLKTQAIIIRGEIDPLEMIVPWNSNQLAHFIDKFVDINNYDFDVDSLTKMYKRYNETGKFEPIN